MKRNARRIPRWWKALYVVLVGAALSWALLDAGPSLLQWRALVREPASYAFVAGWIVMAASLGGLWALLLRWRFGVSLAAREWLPIQAGAWIGRYLPGKLGLLAGKLPMAEHAAIGFRGLGWSVLYEQLAFVTVGAVLATLLIADPAALAATFWPQSSTLPWQFLRWLAIAICLGGFVLAMRLLSARLQPHSPAVPTEAAVPSLQLPPGRQCALLALYAVPHLAAGAGFYLLLGAMLPGTSLSLLPAVGLLALANVAGILAIFAPAGLGVREVVLAAGLAAWVPFPAAVAFAAVLRVLSLVADLGFFLLAGGWRTMSRDRRGAV